jgi:hypothetical protein
MKVIGTKVRLNAPEASARIERGAIGIALDPPGGAGSAPGSMHR